MKKFKKSETVMTVYGTGKVMYEDEDSMTVVVQFSDKSQRTLPKFQVDRLDKNGKFPINDQLE